MHQVRRRRPQVRGERRPVTQGEAWRLVLGILVCLLAFSSTTTAQTVPVTIVLELERDLPFGASCIPQSTLCDPARNSILVFNELVLAEVETKQEALDALPKPRLIGGDFRYERVDFDNQLSLNLNGSLYSTHLRLILGNDTPGRHSIHQFSYGLLIPYDFFDLESLQAQRVGAIGFGRYTYALSETTGLRLTGNGNYAYTDIDVSGFAGLHTVGGGGSLSLVFDTLTSATKGDATSFFGSLAVSYQFHTDTSSQDNHSNHLLKLGGNAGVRIGSSVVTNFSLALNHDFTDYRLVIQDVDRTSFDLGVEVAWSVSPSWRLNLGYNRVLGLTAFTSDLVFVGTIFRF